MPDFAVKSPIVARINSLLAAKGIPKQQFYKDCSITSASYSLWNTGKTNPSMKNLKIIAEYLGVSVADLLPDEELVPQEGIKKERPADGEARVCDLPESIQKIINICLDRPELASALLTLAQQIEKG
jgi:transcriptional regulator with XRE-family HTH domain